MDSTKRLVVHMRCEWGSGVKRASWAVWLAWNLHTCHMELLLAHCACWAGLLWPVARCGLSYVTICSKLESADRTHWERVRTRHLQASALSMIYNIYVHCADWVRTAELP